MSQDPRSLSEGYFVSFTPQGQKLTTDNLHVNRIQKVVRSEASGGYTLLFHGGEALVSDSQVHLQVLKPFQTEVCLCVYVCVCVCRCVFVIVRVRVVFVSVCMCEQQQQQQHNTTPPTPTTPTVRACHL
jgi:hypothetical protein